MLHYKVLPGQSVCVVTFSILDHLGHIGRQLTLTDGLHAFFASSTFISNILLKLANK